MMKTDVLDCPKNVDASDLLPLKNIISHCTERSELKRGKDNVRKLYDSEVNVICDKRKG